MKNKMSLVGLSLMSLALVGCGGGGAESTAPSTSSNGDQNSVTSSSQKESEASSFVAPVEDDKVHIVVLAGQSGGRGKALNADLTDEQKVPNSEVDILADGMRMENLSNIPEAPSFGELKPVQPGLGDSGTEFGPELGIGETLATRYPKGDKTRKSVIVKYTACGSTFTNHWYSKSLVEDDTYGNSLNQLQIVTDKNGDATGPLTNNLYQMVDKAMEDVQSEGYEAVIDGVIWVHGEQDAKFDVNMALYETALKDFIIDFRSYVGVENLPFVVTEALTNSAKYSNDLRSIQKKVADEMPSVSFVDTKDLYTNTFEPWHFGAKSNFDLGHRAAEELISLNDNRKIVSMNPEEIQVSLNGNTALPTYLDATFENGTTGTVKVEYKGSYTKTLGKQNVPFTATTNWGVFEGNLPVNVIDAPIVTGEMNDWGNAKKSKLGDIGEVCFKTTEEGIYVGANITDTDIWTDGEAWHSGDMGQKGNNDDLRVYLTDSTASNRIPIFLSSANLFRVYLAGSSESEYTPSNNLIDNKTITDSRYHVRTTGKANTVGGASQGMQMEFFLSWDDLGYDYESSGDLKVLVDYNNVTGAENGNKITKANQDVFLGNGESISIDNTDSYLTLSDLL